MGDDICHHRNVNKSKKPEAKFETKINFLKNVGI